MKIRIKKNSIGFNELKNALVNRFPEYTFWELPSNRILAQKNKNIGCLISLHRKSIVIIGTFPSLKKTLLALTIFLLGGIFLPLIIYYIFFYDEFKNIENKIASFIRLKFPEAVKV